MMPDIYIGEKAVNRFSIKIVWQVKHIINRTIT